MVSDGLCVGKSHLFGGEDIIDPITELSIGQTFPYEAQAKALCEQCPFRDQCLIEYGDNEYMIVAGKTPQERFPRRRRWE